MMQAKSITGKILLAVLLFAALSLLCVATAGAQDNWAVKVPPPPSESQRAAFGFQRFNYQTTFEEARLGSFAPVNPQTSIGLPGTVPIAFSNLMRMLYSEIDARFEMITSDGTMPCHLMSNFKQTSPGEWLPGCVSEWDKDGIHYEVGLIMVPADPQPVDLVRVVLKNNSDKEAQGQLALTLDAAPTVNVENDLISDRTKPLVVMDPVVPTERVWRDAGCVDPRTKAVSLANMAGPWAWPCFDWIYCRVGFYGMPIEYLLGVQPGERLQVFPGVFNDDKRLCQEELVTVEGDDQTQKVDPTQNVNEGFAKGGVFMRFVGKDVDGDGYIKIAVQATPNYPQRAVLNVIRAYGMQKELSVAVIKEDKDLPPARYYLNVGRDASSQADFRTAGTDPTVFALRLHYNPTLAPGQEKTYLLRFPAIDRPEPQPHTSYIPHPYDTGESWKPPYAARHPENTAPFGFDVPVGINPADYAVFGPKPRELWDKQLAAAKVLTWETGLDRLRQYWESFIGKAAHFVVPEMVVERLYKKQLVLLAIQQKKLEPHNYYMTTDGPNFYGALAFRSANYATVAMDLVGYSDMSRRIIDTWLTPARQIPPNHERMGQQDDGCWVMREGQWDGQGQVFWSISEHYLMTADKQWLTEHYESIKRGAEWISNRRKQMREKIKDPNNLIYGLMPAGAMEGPGVNAGNSFYLDAWCLKGMRDATMLAREAGQSADAQHFQREGDDYQRAFSRAIQKSFIRYNDFAGTIPDAALSDSVATWSQATMIYPTQTMAPHDPLLTGWLRFREKEGGTIGGLMLWPYIGAELGLAYICRGDYEQSSDLFYTYIANASGTLEWGEEQYLSEHGRDNRYPKDLIPKGIVGHGESPHLWATAFYLHWLRHMLLHEEGDTLHIAPAIPRKWLAQIQPIGVENAPTHFGKVTYHLQADPDRTTIRGDIKLDPQRKPGKLLIHVRGPGGRGLSSVKLNDKVWEVFVGDTIVVSAPEADIQFTVKYKGY